MFTQRFNELLTEVLRVNTGEFARVSRYDRSYISHLRNGDRVPRPGFGASDRLARALLLCAEEQGVRGTLCARLEISDDLSGEELRAALIAWLYGGETTVPRPARARHSSGQGQRGSFGKRLDMAMELANISNLRLAKALSVDVSVIGKYRSGMRVPRVDLPLIRDIGQILAGRIWTLGRVAGLSRLTGAPREVLTDEGACSDHLEAWLRDFSVMDTSLIEDFLDGLDRFSPDTRLSLPAVDQVLDNAILTDEADTYYGPEGLRRAVLRFLGAVVRGGEKRLLLYSDQDMEWLTGDRAFTGKWMVLMSEYIRSGGKIRIVHNVDRGLEEMIAAIRNWLPLYLSGGIESWYCLNRGGERFSHTLFLAPGSGCVSGICVPGREQTAFFRYDTAPQRLRDFETLFGDLVADCRPLLHIEPSSMTFQHPALMRDRSVHFMGKTLSLATMPRELLEQILVRSSLPGPVREDILRDWASQSGLFSERLKSGYIHECVPLPEEETLFAGQVPVDTSHASVFYTPEEYAAHVRALLGFSQQYSGYRFHPLEEPPFERIRLIVSEHAVTFGYASESPVTFVTANPLICRACTNFVERLEEQYDFDRHTIQEMLRRYL